MVILPFSRVLMAKEGEISASFLQGKKIVIFFIENNLKSDLILKYKKNNAFYKFIKNVILSEINF